MLKLHIFLVDTGIMFTFDMEMALESVSKLMEAVYEVTNISVGKQVLLIANGEPLNPSSRVGSYKSAGTETNPIFLFSKSAIESPQPPLSNAPITSGPSLEKQVERCLQLPPTIDTLVSRALLASEFHLSARELGEKCESLVTDQQLQQQGWQAVVFNLEKITLALSKHASVFQDQYKSFLLTREQYLEMFDRFDDVIALLSRIPILPCLTRSDSDFEANKLFLMDWINKKEHQTSLQALVHQCKELLTQFDHNVLDKLMIEINKVLEASDNKSMKEIKGLEERLSSLQERLVLSEQIVQDQADMAQGFKQNQMRAENIGDVSVLPDLCASHRKQLLLLLKNHKQLRDISILCSKAKDELCTNLHTRLRWVMYVEHSICKCDSKLLVFHESLKKMKRRLEVLEQVFEAPRMYVLAVLEILRRKSFSCQFLEWGRNVSLSASEARMEEIDKRNKFSQIFGNHFLHSLFTGLDDSPPSFAATPPSIFDEMLPSIDVNDIRTLHREVPELLVELSLSGSLEHSLYAKEKLSQTNLSKLCDPKSNPKLVETLRLRELTGTNGAQKMTVSQLQKEISQDDIALDITRNQMNWQLGLSTIMTIPSGDFEPSSLKTLPSELQSSQSSEISDSLFRSAEGLDEKETNRMECTGEIFGIIDLSEEATEILSENKKQISKVEESCSNHAEVGNERIEESKERIEDVKSTSPCVNIQSQDTNHVFHLTIESVRHCRSSVTTLKTFIRSCFLEWIGFLDELRISMMDVIGELKRRIDEELDRNMEIQIKFDNEKESVNQLKGDLVAKEKSIEYRYKEEMVEIEMRLKKKFEDIREKEMEKHQEDFKELKQRHESEKSKFVAELKSQLEISWNETVSLKDENHILRKKIEMMREEQEGMELQYKDKLCRIEEEKQVAEKINAEIRDELQVLRSSKSQLHLETQEHFNSALKQVKREKEKSLKELQAMIDNLKNEIEAKIKINEKVKSENAHYKEINSKIMSRIESLENDKEKLETLYTESDKKALQMKKEIEDERRSHAAALEKLQYELNDKFEIEKSDLMQQFEVVKLNLKDEASLEKVRLIEDFKRQRQYLIDEREKELAELKINFEKEKKALFSSIEIEKLRNTEECEKQHLMSKASSIEEGIDALEWEKILQKLKDLEIENDLLKNDRRCKDSMQSQIEELQKVSDDLKRNDRSLQDKLNELKVLMPDSPSQHHEERIVFRQFKVNDLVILCYDELRSNYAALTCEDTKYFLHPDSKSILNLTDNPGDTRAWLLACITDQEYCVAKKAQNRFKLPVGTYFYRIHAKPWKS